MPSKVKFSSDCWTHLLLAKVYELSDVSNDFTIKVTLCLKIVWLISLALSTKRLLCAKDALFRLVLRIIIIFQSHIFNLQTPFKMCQFCPEIHKKAIPWCWLQCIMLLRNPINNENCISQHILNFYFHKWLFIL